MNNVDFANMEFAPRIINAPLELGFPAICKVISAASDELIALSTESCTGTLITPNLVLLASHCFERTKLSRVAIFTLKDSEIEVPIKKVYFQSFFDSAEFSKAFGEQLLDILHTDFAIAELELPVNPNFVKPLPMMLAEEFSKQVIQGKVKELKFVGFGKTSLNAEATSETKRSFTFNDFKLDLNKGLLKVKANQNDRQQQVAVYSGDSGGAYIASIDGIDYIVSVLSYVEFDTQGFPYQSVSTLLDFPVRFFKTSILSGYEQTEAPLGYGYPNKK